MNKKTFLSALTATLLTAATTANATLESRLSGKAFYDTETDLTWAGPEYTATARTAPDQLDFVANLSIAGTGDWRIPTGTEFMNFIAAHTDCPFVPFCIPDEPLASHLPASPTGWTAFYGFKPAIFDFKGDEITLYTGAFRPDDAEWYPGDIWINTAFAVWPVHSGDVPITAVPEPQTYAMLLAGLGLIGSAGRRNTSDNDDPKPTKREPIREEKRKKTQR